MNKHLQDLSRLTVAIAFAASLVIPATSVRAAVWDVGVDCTGSAPTFGAGNEWYFYKNEGEPSPATYGNVAYGLGTNIPIYRAGPGEWWGAGLKNNGAAVLTGWAIYLEAGQVALRSSYGCENGLVWISPITGKISVEARFTGQDNDVDGTNTSLAIRAGMGDPRANPVIWAGDISGFIGTAANGYADGFGTAPELTFSIPLTEIPAGYTLTFQDVGGGNQWQSTGFDIVITQVPEPATALVLAGGLTLALRRRTARR